MPSILVVGNEKGGAGKTTCAMHLIIALLYYGYSVVSIDTDLRQSSLSSYIHNREQYNLKNSSHSVKLPTHFVLNDSNSSASMQEDTSYNIKFIQLLKKATDKKVDYIIIDTPGHHSELSKLAHSHADIIITPINDSFIDLDVMAKINPDNLKVIGPSIYSQMIWEQKMQRAARDQCSIEWVVMRNRLSNLDAVNKRNVSNVLNELAGRIGFKIAPGFSERVIFKELFLHGLTLLDLTIANYDKTFSISHVAARQELRDFVTYLGIVPKVG